MKQSRYELVAPARGQLSSSELPEPGIGQVAIRMLTNGVCASELARWKDGPGSLPAPVLLGHEPVGQVVIAGEGSSLPVGAIVGGRVEESFSDYAIADERDLVVIPEGIDPYATLPEPMGCVVEAVRRTPINPGARVAVIGLGFMGLLMVQLLRNAGTSQIVGVDPRADARKVALLNGADGTLDGAELPRDFYSGEGTPARFGFDVVVEASGSQGGLDLATQLAKSHGVLSILGYHQQERRVDMRMWNWKALDVVNGHVRDRDLLRKSTAAALDLQASGRIDPGSLITHRYPLSDVDTAYQAMATKPDGFIKALIEMPQ